MLGGQQQLRLHAAGLADGERSFLEGPVDRVPVAETLYGLVVNDPGSYIDHPDTFDWDWLRVAAATHD